MKDAHPNRLRCEPCATLRRKRPQHTLTEKQQREAIRLQAKLYRHEIAERLKVSRSNLNRFFRDLEIKSNARDYDEETRRKVCLFYLANGMPATVKQFKGIKVRSIVDRYAKDYGPPRQVRWTPAELIDLCRFVGLAPYGVQASYFDRPNAGEGSIKSFWSKRGPEGGSYINGLPFDIARHFILRSCPMYSVYVRKKGWVERKIILWIDLSEHIREDLPEHIASVIHAMANFQKWLHGKSYRKRITEILRGDL